VSDKPTIGTSTFDPASDTVKLDALQTAYAPAKAGDAMTLTAAYDASKTVASVTIAAAIKAKTDNLPASPAAVDDIPAADINVITPCPTRL
jgi:hypothetical protein